MIGQIGSRNIIHNDVTPGLLCPYDYKDQGSVISVSSVITLTGNFYSVIFTKLKCFRQ